MLEEDRNRLRVTISPETAKKFNTPVNGCTHPRQYLVLVNRSEIVCLGCEEWFYVIAVEDPKD